MKFPISIALGAIAGIIFSLTWYLMAKSMGFYNVDVYVLVNFLIIGLILLGVFLSVFIVKRKNNGYLEFKSALQTGMLYCLIFAVFASLFNFIYYKYITPDTIDFFVSDAKRYGETVLKLKEDQIPKYLDAERARFGSFKLVPSILFWGLIISLIAGLVFQKKKPQTFSAN